MLLNQFSNTFGLWIFFISKSEMITDAIYSSFKEGELKNKIASLGDNGGNDSGVSEEIIEKIANSTLAK